MKFKPLLVLIFSLMILNTTGQGRAFYIDQINGNDSNSGFKPEDAWATISKINSTEFGPGDKILFCGGQTFTGTIRLKKLNGTIEQNITISSYGAGRATISGGNTEAFVADSCSFLSVLNLSFVGAGRKNGNTTSGVVINRCNGIIIDSTDVSGFKKPG